MTVFIDLDGRGGLQSFGGSALVSINAWCLKYFGRDALHFAQTLAVRFNGARLVLRGIAVDRLFVRTRLLQAGVNTATIAFRIDPVQQRSHLSWVKLVPAVRGTRTLKHALQNLLVAMRDCGTVRLTLQAALTHGGYVWATYGFLPETPAEWTRLSSHLQTKLAVIKNQLSATELAAIDKILTSPNPLAIRAVAAIQIPVSGTTVGKHLLLGTVWNGQLDFSDRPSMLIFLERIGLIP